MLNAIILTLIIIINFIIGMIDNVCFFFVQPVKLLFLFNSVVVNILQKDMFPQDVDTEIRRGCYAICLQLARFVFFLREM